MEQGFRVAVIDCDPLNQLYGWWMKAVHHDGLAARAARTHDISRHINTFKDQVDYIIIDLSGASDVMNALAFALSDLVLVPMQGSAVDARGAAHTIELINLVAQNRRSMINTSVVLTRVSPLVVTNSVRYATRIISALGVAFLEVPILERSAFRDMFSHMTNLFNASEATISNIAKARRDIAVLTDAVTTRAQLHSAALFANQQAHALAHV
jgi:chromosome partitioning protein